MQAAVERKETPAKRTSMVVQELDIILHGDIMEIGWSKAKVRLYGVPARRTGNRLLQQNLTDIGVSRAVADLVAKKAAHPRARSMSQ
jgi:hypothetical protein